MKAALRIALLLAILFAAFQGYQLLWSPVETDYFPKDGQLDLTGADLASGLAFVSARNWEYYPGQLLTPDDFAAGRAPAPVITSSPAAIMPYGTHRVHLRLTPGIPYGITGKSFMNAQRVYIDGILQGEVGSPGSDRESTLPATRQYLYAFTPQHAQTEIIFQVADFYTADGGGRYPFAISQHSNALRLFTTKLTLSFLLAGCLVAACLFYLGMFMFFPGKKQFLYFALFCLFYCVRLLLTEHKPLLEILPGISWRAMYTAEYLSTIWLPALFLLYMESLYHRLVGKWSLRIVLGVTALYSLLVLLMEPVFYSRFLYVQLGIGIGLTAVMLIRLAPRVLRGPRSTESALVLLSVAILIFGALNDVAYYLLNIGTIRNLWFERSVIICVFLHMVALALGFSQTETMLDTVRRQAVELDASNRLLDRLNTMKTQFLADISHEMKTPLTVMSVNAQLSRVLLDIDADRAEIQQAMGNITDEVDRLSRMVTDLLALSSLQEAQADFAPVDMPQLMHKTAEVLRPLLTKRGNTIALSIPDAAPPVRGNADMLVQVLVNLLSNAGAHTRDGTVTLALEPATGFLRIAVRDSGTGIDPALLETLFERRQKDAGSGGAGLGLAIATQIVKRHGGEIGAYNNKGGAGATVWFTLPTEDAV